MGLCDSMNRKGEDESKTENKQNQYIKKEVDFESSPIDINEIKELYSNEPAICKIRFEVLKDGEIKNGLGTGFFCDIDNNDLPFRKALFTNNHVLDENRIKINKKIEFEYCGKNRIIEITKNRRVFTNKELDYTCIEIFNTDNINKFLNIDKAIFDDKNSLIKKDIFILQYPGKLLFHIGKILDIKNNIIEHKIPTKSGSSGSPLIKRYNNNLVIGIHFGAKLKIEKSEQNKDKSNENYECNLATPFDVIIKDIINQFKNHNSDKIELKKVIQTTINKKDKISIINYGQLSKNIMTIKYKISKDRNYNKIRLFGKEFVKNNIDNCEIIIEGKPQKIVECLELNYEVKKKGILEIKLKETKTITNMSHMFCRGIDELDEMLLFSITDIDEFDTRNITDMSYLFCCCENIRSLPDISSWNTSNVKNMSNMISYCECLESLPDISKWDTKNVTNMSHMFRNSIMIKKFPDISKWNTSNVNNMEHMFSYCLSLHELPNISEWDVSKVSNMSFMFSHCGILESIPDISKWNTKNVINIKGMFYCCTNLRDFPDITKWNTENLVYCDCLFYYCNQLHNQKDFKKRLKEKLNIRDDYFDVWKGY